MKKRILLLVVAFAFLSNLNAYELNGDLGVKWTGFKTEKKAPVSGTFNEINLNIKNSDKLSDFLTSAKVKITTASFESKNPERNTSIVSTLFSLASSKMIEGTITKVDEKAKTLILDVTMNQVTKAIPMTYEIIEGNIIAKGTIEILDFNMKDSFLAFAKKCAELHENKSYTDVNIEFTIPFK
ncbi:MAG: YceI family protein [Aliarcobacter sp.]|nr:YceI family protein [Aliarcobacter sp.]